MSRATVIAGVAAGFVLGAFSWGVVASRPWLHKVAPNETITFSDRIFFDDGSTPSDADGFVRFSGTYTGDDIHSNNTMSAVCSKADSRCELAETAQIGAEQVSEIDIADWQVTQWSPNLIVAQSAGMCATTTMNINRHAQTVSFVTIPSNLEKSFCSTADTKVRRWTVGRSLYWSRNDAARTTK